jgi:hypothetical protein
MKKITGDEPAFKSIPRPENDEQFHHDGLTIRQHFAAMAMQGLLANPELTKMDDAVMAMTCLDAADALITALNSKTENV